MGQEEDLADLLCSSSGSGSDSLPSDSDSWWLLPVEVRNASAKPVRQKKPQRGSIRVQSERGGKDKGAARVVGTPSGCAVTVGAPRTPAAMRRERGKGPAGPGVPATEGDGSAGGSQSARLRRLRERAERQRHKGSVPSEGCGSDTMGGMNSSVNSSGAVEVPRAPPLLFLRERSLSLSSISDGE
jgi:hypothetical protein